MGRVISDGGTCYHIIDFVVDPAHQRQGLGREIMRTIMDWLEKNAPAGANINLIADLPADKLYAQFGFRPTAPGSIAMDQWLSVKGDKH
jgi:GNAT superfamily N-acetyltransferase